MTKLIPCPRCRAFLPSPAGSCPHCARAVPPWFKRAAVILGSSAVAMTLSACYGAPCANNGECYRPVPDTNALCADPAEDLDGDGACGQHDCDERDPAVQSCESY